MNDETPHYTYQGPVVRAGRQSKSDRTRQQIIDTAVGFMWQHPIREMTVSTLMKETPFARSVFYVYFHDIPALCKVLLDDIQNRIMAGSSSWFGSHGDPVALLYESLGGLIDVMHEGGPLIKGIEQSASTDAEFEHIWESNMAYFDQMVAERITRDQELGLIRPGVDPEMIAIALNRADVGMCLHAFGKLPRGDKQRVLDAEFYLWTSLLYGAEFVESRASPLRRPPA